MEPISEERQRKVYEWLYPELKEKDFVLCNGNGAMPRRAFWTNGGVARSKELELVYVWDKGRNWQPNYQFFFTEIAPRLAVAKVRVSYNLMGCPEWYLDPETDPHIVYIHADPVAATAEYIEALEGR